MVFVETIALVALTSLLLYYFVTKNNNYWEKRGIPFVKPLPLVGNMMDNLLGRKTMGQIMKEIYGKFPNEKVCGTFIFTNPTLMIRDPEIVAQILTTDYQHFAKNNIEIDETLDPVLGRNMFFLTGESWKRTRQALSPAFTINKIRANYEKFVTQADKLVKYMEKNPVVEMKSVYALYTSEVVADTGLGIDGHSFTDEDAVLPKLGKMVFTSSFTSLIKFLVIAFLPIIGKILRLRFAPKLFYDYFDEMLRDLIKSRSKENAKRTDLLQYYIDLRDKRLVHKNDDQKEINEDDIVAGVVSFFMEGYETSSVVGSLLLQHLVQDQQLQKRLQEEVDDLFVKTNGKPSLEDINDLQLLHRIFQESLRFYPVDTMGKVCTKSCELDIGDGRKLKVEEGLAVIISTGGIHMDPKYWENPSKFDPDRFLEENQAKRPKGTYLPFGDGPRICIGQRQASAAIKVATVKIVRHFNLVATPKSSPVFVQDPLHFLSSQKGGVNFRVVKRNI